MRYYWPGENTGGLVLLLTGQSCCCKNNSCDKVKVFILGGSHYSGVRGKRRSIYGVVVTRQGS